MLALFQKHGISAKTFAFRVDREEHQVDVGVLWGDHLFVFECKNYVLPGTARRDRFTT
jgi:hypothetical protein